MQAMRPRPSYIPSKPIPNQPFIPKISSLTLSYRAKSEINIEGGGDQTDNFRIVQTGPFGIWDVGGDGLQIFPQRIGYGSLYFQIKKTNPNYNLSGELSLAFDIARRARRTLKCFFIRLVYFGCRWLA